MSDAGGPTIYIVDDEQPIRDSLQLLLEAEGFPRVVAVGSSRQFLDEIVPGAGDIMIVDVRMPDIDGLELQAQLTARGINLPIIVMTGHGDVPIAVRAMKAGAIDFLEKPFAEELFLESIRRALEKAAESRESDDVRDIAERYETLTPREREVLSGMVNGQPNKVIAYGLGISPRTVEIHRARVMEKMAAGSLSLLVRMALAAHIGGATGLAGTEP